MKKNREHTELENLMKQYAMTGLYFWENCVSGEEQKRVKNCLGNAIAEIEDEVDAVVFEALNRYQPDSVKFIPMPGPVRNVDYAFFRPIRTFLEKNRVRMSFGLFLIVAQRDEKADLPEVQPEVPPVAAKRRDKCLAFRWELPEEETNTHGYAHIQFCRNMAKGGPDHPGIPDWLPESYPAIPIGTDVPLEMFLSLATSVHGIDLKNDPATFGLDRILYEAFKSESSEARKFQSMIRKTVGITIS